MGARSGRPEVSASTSAAVVVCFLVASASGFCPHACTCDAALRTAACPGSADLDIIPITLNPNIESLVLAGNRIKTVDASIQFYRKLQRADFSDNRISVLPDSRLNSQKLLRNLTLDSNKIANLTHLTFVGLRSLRRLSMRDNLIRELRPNVFAHLEKLEYLDLGRNRIESISKPACFSGLSNLASLHLEGNRLIALPPDGALAPLRSLRTLRLDFNKRIGAAGPFAFQSLTGLENLGLRGCGLSTANLSVDAFARLPHLKSLDISGNKMKVVPTTQLSHLSNLEALQLGGNPIQVLGSNFLKGLTNLRRLNFSDSTDLLKVESGAFLALSTLGLIVFDRCPRLRSFGEGAFADLQVGLSLRDNEWTSVPPEVFSPRDNGVASIDVADNPITCDCNALPLFERLRHRGDSFGNESLVVCVHPEEWRGVPLADVEDEINLIKCLETSVTVDSQSRPVAVSEHIDGGTPSSSSSAAAAANDPPGGGLGVHDQRLMMISVCVMSAVVTGVTVFALVHCRHAASRATSACAWRLRGADARPPGYSASPGARSPNGMSLSPSATPLQCLCCEMTFGGGGKSSGRGAVRREAPGNLYHEGPNGSAYHSTYNTATAASSSSISSSQLITAGSGFSQQRLPQEVYYNQEVQPPPTIYRDYRRPAHSYRGQRHSALTTAAAEFDFSTMSSAGTSLAHPPPSSSPPSVREGAGRVSGDDYFISIAQDGSVIKPIPVSEL